ncbi:MAG: winged helix-turn-helix transcriptional regulator [Candidatus Methanomethylophilaceae archaeon]
MKEIEHRMNCAIDATMSVIEGRWKGTILCMLCMNGTMRFSELQKRIGEITSRILTKQLKELEEDGMIVRKVITDGKIRVEYSLTDRGHSILPVLYAIAEWGARNQFVQVIVPKSEEAESTA